MNKFVKGTLLYFGGLVSGIVLCEKVLTSMSVKANNVVKPYSCTDITFPTKRELDEAINIMNECCDKWGHFSVADYYEIAGLGDKVRYTDAGYGWTKSAIHDIRMIRTKDGYSLGFPTAPIRIR
jgi:hypothetical protein